MLTTPKSPKGDLNNCQVKTKKPRSMFFGALPGIFEKAASLRNNMTDAEKILWNFLSGSKVMGLRFKSQHPIDRFIADFYCHALKIVIEVDGGIHSLLYNRENDINRTYELEKFDIKIIRFRNEQILNDLANVKKEIINICNLRKAELKVPFRGFRGKK